MKRTIFSLLITLLSLTAFAGSTSKIEFADPVYDFGNVKENGGIVSHGFIFKNTGNAASHYKISTGFLRLHRSGNSQRAYKTRRISRGQSKL